MANLDEMAIFAAVVETTGFSAAARRLEISKSAVSKAVNRLEDRLGVRMLHRTTRKISLTEAGEVYYGFARSALSEADAAEDAVVNLSRRPRGKLRVTAPMSLSIMHLACLIPGFMQKNPGIQVDLVLGDEVKDLIEGGFDMAIRIGHLRSSSLVARKISSMHAVVCATPEYLTKHGEPRTPTELMEHNCLLFSYLRDPHEWRFIGPNGPASVRVSGNYQANNSLVLRTAALRSLGIARVPLYVVGADLAAGKLVEVLPDYKLESPPIYAV
ncbi:MAG: LysR family transcriptional regulator, partial [Gammaproteobacteria bacterium]|nr:LysR family transcriptional regulator [Gammaproteobacteria bacterium]